MTAFIYLQSSYLKIPFTKRQRKKSCVSLSPQYVNRCLEKGTESCTACIGDLNAWVYFFSWYIVKTQHNPWKWMKLNPDTCISVVAIWEYWHSSSELEVLWAVCGLLTFKQTVISNEQGRRIWELILSLFVLTGPSYWCPFWLCNWVLVGYSICSSSCFWAWILLKRGNPNTLQFSATCPLMPDFL